MRGKIARLAVYARELPRLVPSDANANRRLSNASIQLLAGANALNSQNLRAATSTGSKRSGKRGDRGLESRKSAVCRRALITQSNRRCRLVRTISETLLDLAAD